MDYDSRRVGARSLRVSHVIKIKSRFALVAWDTSMKKLLQNCETCQSVVSLSLSFHFRNHDGLYFKHEDSNTHTSRGYWVMKEKLTWDATSVTASFRLGPTAALAAKLGCRPFLQVLAKPRFHLLRQSAMNEQTNEGSY